MNKPSRRSFNWMTSTAASLAIALVIPVSAIAQEEGGWETDAGSQQGQPSQQSQPSQSPGSKKSPRRKKPLDKKPKSARGNKKSPVGSASPETSVSQVETDAPALSPDDSVKRAAELVAKGFRFAPIAMLLEVAQAAAGRQAQEDALAALEQLAQTGPYDLDRTLSLASELRLKSKSPAVSAFLSYHVALLNFRDGHSKWAANEMSSVVGGTFWKYRWLYDQVLRRYRKDDDADAALKGVQKIAKLKNLPPAFRKELSLNQARLHFELGQFHKAEEVYAKLETGLRDWGRTTLERAWANYHLKDYSRTLGLLQSLRAPYFNPSLEPERVVLEILVLNQVCDHEAIIALVNDARIRYSSFVESVKNRKDLIEDVGLINQALLEHPLRDKGEQVEETLKEIALLEKSGIGKQAWAKPMLAALKSRETELREEIDFDSREALDRLADVNLKFLEQIEFLDYQARLEAANRKASNAKEPAAAPALPLDRVSWPQRYNEFWLDEFPNYQIRLKNYCVGGKP